METKQELGGFVDDAIFRGVCPIKLYGSLNYGFVIMAKFLTVNMNIDWGKSVIYSHLAINYEGKSIIAQLPIRKIIQFEKLNGGQREN